jgi:hypothetical protein
MNIVFDCMCVQFIYTCLSVCSVNLGVAVDVFSEFRTGCWCVE